MASGKGIRLSLKRRVLTRDSSGHRRWQEEVETREAVPAETALIICDMWDRHWCKGAQERVTAMLPKFNSVVKAARAKGILIVHAPSETMDFYKDAPARKRAQDAPPVTPPPDLAHRDPPLPVDASNGGCDTDELPDASKGWPWTRQHAGIEIDQARDVISDNGLEILSVFRAR